MADGGGGGTPEGEPGVHLGRHPPLLTAGDRVARSKSLHFPILHSMEILRLSLLLLYLQMSSSNRTPQRDGKPPASPVPQAPPSPPPTFSPDYWDGFYIDWKMALVKASRLYGDKGLTNILPEIGPRAEHIFSSPPSPPSPARSASSPPSPTDWSGYGV
ncbi:hypothetical protein Taro_033032 [Colocasia esculenta]|uniref:Uncharacterized protein n=1 Tax=Colocasia esculenta TaxID=4460 RepID=A0A843W0L3_COLES|nr:hypothetical protein [Colocasia esculenta]